jgi:hypothetical protein
LDDKNWTVHYESRDNTENKKPTIGAANEVLRVTGHDVYAFSRYPPTRISPRMSIDVTRAEEAVALFAACEKAGGAATGAPARSAGWAAAVLPHYWVVQTVLS